MGRERRRGAGEGKREEKERREVATSSHPVHT